MANLRGLTRKTGVNMRPMQTANNAKAASRRPPKTSNRSHRLTMNIGQRRSAWLVVELEMATAACETVLRRNPPSVTPAMVRSRRSRREST
jgi:hypothetical protein